MFGVNLCSNWKYKRNEQSFYKVRKLLSNDVAHLKKETRFDSTVHFQNREQNPERLIFNIKWPNWYFSDAFLSIVTQITSHAGKPNFLAYLMISRFYIRPVTISRFGWTFEVRLRRAGNIPATIYREIASIFHHRSHHAFSIRTNPIIYDTPTFGFSIRYFR